MRWESYERSEPLSVKGGIKLRAKKNKLNAHWWEKRWIDALESFEDAARLSRGRSYARKGQVIDIDITQGKVAAKVQGSREKPYQVTIEVEKLSSQAWNLVIEVLAQKALYIARLYAGELPKEIEEIFKEVNVSLLPSHYGDLSTDCSCPDWSNPCKHVAAVLYLLAEEFGRDPFLLFKVRGMERETFLRRIEEHSSIAQNSCSLILSKESIPLSDGTEFWMAKEIPDNWLTNAFKKPSQSGTVLKSLGKFPFWRGEQDLISFLEPIYSQASKSAIELILEKK